LNASDAGQAGGFANLFRIGIDENPDGAHSVRYLLNDLSHRRWFNVARALAEKIESNHVGTEFNTRTRVVLIRNAADFDLDGH
jgi:hypothetical protein